MTDLFSPAEPKTDPHAPLAERMRPRTLAEVIGQSHLTGEGMPLAITFSSGKPHSMILWGPPGVGKTTIARLMANAFDADFIALSAVLSGRELSIRQERAQWALFVVLRQRYYVADRRNLFDLQAV